MLAVTNLQIGVLSIEDGCAFGEPHAVIRSVQIVARRIARRWPTSNGLQAAARRRYVASVTGGYEHQGKDPKEPARRRPPRIFPFEPDYSRLHRNPLSLSRWKHARAFHFRPQNIQCPGLTLSIVRPQDAGPDGTSRTHKRIDARGSGGSSCCVLTALGLRSLCLQRQSSSRVAFYVGVTSSRTTPRGGMRTLRIELATSMGRPGKWLATRTLRTGRRMSMRAST